MLVAAARWERLATLAPVFVVGAGLVGAVLILLIRAFADSVRGLKHKRAVAIGLVAFLGVIVLLTYLGIELPKEE